MKLVESGAWPMPNLEASYLVHSHALVESAQTDARSRVLAFVHILPGARIVEDCIIIDHVLRQADKVISESVTLKPGSELWYGLRIEGDIFIGPRAAFTNDSFPRSRQSQPAFAVTAARTDASAGEENSKPSRDYDWPWRQSGRQCREGEVTARPRGCRRSTGADPALIRGQR